ncbi:MAG TPA: AmmeMemoRadiSam system protein B [Candidatus Krumholzibacteria bacterium]|nr:AmmeMemoRadiSam system protein B [Candidatus Krumholzibacteria bacterium]
MSVPRFQPAGVRPAAVAGSWYPDDRAALTAQIEAMLQAAGPQAPRERLRAVVAPHAGLRYSGPTAAVAYAGLSPERHQRILVLAPSHHVPLRGLAVDPSSEYESPLGRMRVDVEAVERLATLPNVVCSPRPFATEHAIEMQLPFLQHRLPEASLVPVLVGEEVDAVARAAVVSGLVTLLDERTLVVVSSDFMHYGRAFDYVPFTEDVPTRIEGTDAEAIAALARGSASEFEAVLQRTGNTICGRRPLLLVLRLAASRWKGELLAYTTSGAISGDWSHSVSYAAMAFSEGDTPEALQMELTNADKRELLRLARNSIARAIGAPHGESRAVEKAALRLQRGAFVSLRDRRDGNLRGCIGWLEPKEELHAAVSENATSAALRDPRFDPVVAAELPHLEIEISVLGPVQDVKGVEEIRMGRDGLVVAHEGKRGILLPQVPAHMGWNRLQLLEGLCRKAGLPADAWRRGAHIQRFEADVFSESQLGMHADAAPDS